MRCANALDQGIHFEISFELVTEHRQQSVAHIFHAALPEFEIDDTQKLAVRSSVADQRFAARVTDTERLRYGVVSVATQDNIDTSHTAGQLEINIHSIVRQQHDGIDFFCLAKLIDNLLKFVFADAKRPIWYTAWDEQSEHRGMPAR